MKAILFSIFLISFSLAAQRPEYSVFLIGDAGEHAIPDSNLLLLKKQLEEYPNSCAVFLGDNIYPEGLIEGKKNDKQSHQIISAQLNELKDYRGSLYYVPGNHDWANSNDFEKGKARLKGEEEYVTTFLRDHSSIQNKNENTFLPSNGKPGPVQRELNNEKIKIIFIDSQWFMYLYYKKSPPWLKDSAAVFYSAFENELNEAKQKNEVAIVVAHHPLYTNASHSKQHRLLGFVKRLKYQDLISVPYGTYAKHIDSILKKFPGTIYAAGHDHGLQYFRYNGNDYIVSGGGSKTTAFSKRDEFNPDHPFKEVAQQMKEGFFRIDFFEDGSREIWMIAKNKVLVF